MVGFGMTHLVTWAAAQEGMPASFYVANVSFAFFVLAFAYGNILYQLTRLGYYQRLRSHKPADGSVMAHPSAPTLSILIPSYKEEIRTIEQTVLSAALQGYPIKTVALLLDDPVANSTADMLHIQKTKEKMDEIHQSLHTEHIRYVKIYNQAWHRLQAPEPNLAKENEQLARTYRALAAWFNREAKHYGGDTHTDKLFVREVYAKPVSHYDREAAKINGLKPAEILKHYAYLRDLFDVRISVFQRKAYQSLSHEPNKAMNLNSYLSLMGGTYDADMHPTSDDARIAHSIPDSDYVITLDADSIIDHSYAKTLIHVMEAPGNERIAVAQTPYSSIPGSPGILERTAGATTDIQYIVHQGFTRFHSTYWVGANALLRKQALEDIAEPIPGQALVRQYIQDRTVIEDTESSIDLVQKGWTLYNYPERLAFSATPNDYGSLIIQRRRWANGGLIILPKLLAYLFLRPSAKKISEGFMRIHYLASIALVNVSLILMLFVPLEKIGFSIWIPLMTVPYFALYCRDLKLLGYTASDWMRVYALNLLLIPINLGGVLKSLQQIATGKKIPFGRTPKVDARTAAPLLYYILPYGLLSYCIYLTTVDVLAGEYLNAALIGGNGFFIGYALVRMVGLRETFADMRAASRKLFAIRKTSTQASETTAIDG
jgi:cellulose synthase/poly-beta-1,6-N-acetylglucosamine synthase-like glycosyltransferase